MTDISSEDEDNNESHSEDIEHLKRLLESGEIGIKVESIEFFAGSSSGDNYMSVVKRVLVKGRGSAGDAFDFQKSFIIKRQIPSLSRRQLYRCDEAFNNEINAYNHVVPLLEQYSGQNSPFPKCFYAGKDEDGEIIILEDLKQLNFRMKDRSADMDLDHCTVVMKELSKWHAASILSKKIHPKYEDHIKQLKEIVYCSEAEDLFKKMFDSSMENTLESSKSSNIDGQLTEPIEKLKTFRGKLYDLNKKFVTEASTSNHQFSLICHGDLWVNNIMFKWDPVSCLPTDCKFFDLQAMRCTSPAFDILHFIFTSTKRSLRDSHFTELLEIYISSLHDELDKGSASSTTPLNSVERTAIKTQFSFKMIEEEVRKYILYGLGVAIWILPAVTFDSNNIPNLDAISEQQEFQVSMQLTSEYHSRVKDLLLEFHENQWF